MKVYLIDESNNNRVIGFFNTKTEANEHLEALFSEDCSGISDFSEFEEQYSFVSEEEMNEAVQKYGGRVKQYWT